MNEWDALSISWEERVELVIETLEVMKRPKDIPLLMTLFDLHLVEVGFISQCDIREGHCGWVDILVDLKDGGSLNFSRAATEMQLVLLLWI